MFVMANEHGDMIVADVDMTTLEQVITAPTAVQRWMVIGMAKEFDRGDPIFIPFCEGKTVTDSQLMPRMYKTVEAFQKYFPGGYIKRDAVELAEFTEVVRCKDCIHGELDTTIGCCVEEYYYCNHDVMEHGLAMPNDFCSYGARRTDG